MNKEIPYKSYRGESYQDHKVPLIISDRLGKEIHWHWLTWNLIFEYKSYIETSIVKFSRLDFPKSTLLGLSIAQPQTSVLETVFLTKQKCPPVQEHVCVRIYVFAAIELVFLLGCCICQHWISSCTQLTRLGKTFFSPACGDLENRTIF